MRREIEFSIEGGVPGIRPRGYGSEEYPAVTFTKADETRRLNFEDGEWRAVIHRLGEIEMQGQQTFTVDKPKLLTILKENRAKHIEKYEIAKKKFREAVVAKLEEHLLLAETGMKIHLHVQLSEPTLHVEEYDNVIGLLELCKDEEIEINWQDYKSYVKDEWNWSSQFVTSTAAYLGQGA